MGQGHNRAIQGTRDPPGRQTAPAPMVYPPPPRSPLIPLASIMYSTITSAANASETSPDAVAVLLFQGEVPGSDEFRGVLGDAGVEAVRAAASRPEWTGASGSVATAYPKDTDAPERVFLIGLGKREAFQGRGRGEALRAAGAALVKAASAGKVSSVRVSSGGSGGGIAVEGIEPHAAGGALADGMSAAMFEFRDFQGAAKRAEPGQGSSADDTPEEAHLKVLLGDAIRGGFDAGLTVGRCVATARTLAATPPNVANPSYLIEQCRTMAERVGLMFDVINADRAAAEGMGGLLAVGSAGSTPPAVIVLEWPGSEDRAAAEDPVMLVGKAVTFDTGGYSLKTGGGMSGMKYDKCGGTAVIAAMEAAARLGVRRRVVGLIPTAENMIATEAYRVDDILKFCNGVTAEVTNTDAEGRLILADALAYGTRTYSPAAVIDLATLTGGVVTALGDTAAGMFCNDDTLREHIQTAAEESGERVWRLPLWDEHRDGMRGTHADLVNSADRKAHPIQGAAFLSFFVGGEAPQKMPTTPWCHLDIAGVASVDKDTPLYKKGPTGWGVRLLAAYLQRA